jgi:hypothetical protein
MRTAHPEPNQIMLRTCILTVCLATPALAQTTLHVDDDGSQPGQFSTIGAALAVASPGDRILVQGGAYPGFSISRGVTIVAQGQPRIVGTVSITAVPAGELVVLSGFGLDFSAQRLALTDCSGTVWVDGCTIVGGPPSGARLFEIRNCVDARLQRCIVRPSTGPFFAYTGLSIINSRVELSDCDIKGGDRIDSAGTPKDGGVGVRCSQQSRVHLARTTVEGGKGGNGDSNFGTNGASGGDALEASTNSTVIVAGDSSDVIRGGARGTPSGFSWPLNLQGSGAYGGFSSSLRHSGVAIVDGANAPSISWFATVTAPAVPDPTLELVGATTVGAPILFTLHGPPTLNGRLQQGKSTRLLPDALSVIEQLNDRFRLHALGPIGSNGHALFPFTVPANVQPGWLRTFQGLTIDPFTGDLGERTNSVLVLAR